MALATALALFSEFMNVCCKSIIFHSFVDTFFLATAPITIHYNGRHKKSFEVGHFFTVGTEIYNSVLKNLPITQNLYNFSEPGYYQDREFGVRLENVLEVHLVRAKVSKLTSAMKRNFSKTLF
jgi:Xaa-Pro aminopeptidase